MVFCYAAGADGDKPFLPPASARKEYGIWKDAFEWDYFPGQRQKCPLGRGGVSSGIQVRASLGQAVFSGGHVGLDGSPELWCTYVGCR